MTEPTPEVVISPEAAALLETGARPVSVDVEALLEQMRALQSRVDSLSIAQGIPADPIAAQVQSLRDHVQIQASVHPGKDFSEVLTALKDLPESGELTPAHTELVKSVVEDHLSRFASIAHDLGYVWQLVGDLH